MAVLCRAAEFGFYARGRNRDLVAKEPSKTFSDTQNNWAASIFTLLSSYCCSVASALNEIGARFAFDDSAQRNYAAAATLRILKCVKVQ